ncbi:hypothetical protein CAPN007_11610 [Capnocytophaga canimorsus]|nr:hypothetical protein CAPN007_11610 [Capnocytophaga canimorsus]
MQFATRIYGNSMIYASFSFVFSVSFVGLLKNLKGGISLPKENNFFIRISVTIAIRNLKL